MCYKKFSLVFLLLSVRIVGLSQFNSPNPTVPAASIDKQSVEISNDLYNGKVAVSFPLYKYGISGVSIPISLSYAGGNGLKPDELPSWVGSGWNLNASGFVHRTVRGKPDEMRDIRIETYKSLDAIANGWSGIRKKTYLHSTDYSYMANYNKLSGTNWNNSTYINTFALTIPNLPNSALINNNYILLTSYNDHPYYDLVPDEFTFSVGAMSGKFYYNHMGQWVVETNDGKDYKVEVNAGEQVAVHRTITLGGFNLTTHCTVPRLIKSIVITSSDGIRYYFGNTDVNATLPDQYFDFSHSSALEVPGTPITGLMADEPNGTTFTGLTDVVPSTWHLTKIENLRTYETITFSYKATYQYYLSLQAYGWGGSGTAGGKFIYSNYPQGYFSVDLLGQFNMSNEQLSALSKVLTRTWSLTAINLPGGNKIEFNSSPSTQLGTNVDINFSYACGFRNYVDMLMDPNLPANNTLLKLNYMSVIDNNSKVVKKVDFGYALSTSQRMQLASMEEKMSVIPGITEKYEFTYNNATALPAYGAGKTDHWGLYNNMNFFESVPPDISSINYQYSYGVISNYANYRAPNETYAKAEILTKVKYPTGGSTVFEYKSNSYSKKRVDWNNASITSIGSDQLGGGVRLDKILYYTDDNQLVRTKVFDYTIPGSGLSSGVLSQLPAQYLRGTSTSFDFQATGYNPIYYSGSPVTYTYVAEKEIGNGKVQYEYTNYDSYNDALSAYTNFTGYIYDFEFGYINNAFKRGKPKSTKYFVEGGTSPIKEIIYNYEHENDESQKQEVRSVYLDHLTASSYAAVSERRYADPVISMEEILHSASGNMSSRKTSLYDVYGNVKETKSFVNNGEVVKVKIKYCYEYGGTGTDDASLGIKFLNDLGIKNAAIETVRYKESVNGSNSRVIGASLTTYKPQMPFPDKEYNLRLASPIAAGSFVESSTGSGFTKDSRYTIQDVEYNGYDVKGNILQATDQGGIKQSFKWGYNADEYLVAKVQNASNISYASGPATSYVSIPSTTFAGTLLTYTFHQYRTSNVGINLVYTAAPNPNNTSLQVSCTLGSSNFNLCLATNNDCISSGLNHSGSFTNVQPGDYTLYIFVSNAVQIPNCRVEVSYYNMVSSGSSEFFYNGFEQDPSGISSSAYAGRKGYAGDYTVPFTKPNSRQYKINYHYLEGNQWKNIIKDFSDNMSLTEGSSIDEVRVYPSDGQMTTYTYDPLIGMTSETDVNGRTVYYEYDALGRLTIVRDQDKNIIKKICYNYAGQPESCIIWYNDAIDADYYSQNCGSNGSPLVYHVSIPAGAYASTTSQATANASAQAAAQNEANVHGTCQNYVTIYGNVNVDSHCYLVEFLNPTTGFHIFFDLVNGYSTLGAIPPGNYEVNFYSSYGCNNGTNQNFSAGCSSTASSDGTAHMSNVTISTSCFNVSIY